MNKLKKYQEFQRKLKIEANKKRAKEALIKINRQTYGNPKS